MGIIRTHTYEKHENCNLLHCNICDGGLSVCTLCGGTEASLTTHCCGYHIDGTTQERISSKKIDFVNGRWVYPTAKDAIEHPIINNEKYVDGDECPECGCTMWYDNGDIQLEPAIVCDCGLEYDVDWDKIEGSTLLNANTINNVITPPTDDIPI